MLRKLDEVRVMRDPVHEYIHIEYKIIWDCLNAREFQRLKRIHQLGTTYQVYHTAEHSRFSHSLGVYEIVRRMCNEIYHVDSILTEEDKVIVMLAGLLHDVGHGPFSHIFESITNVSHEDITQDIILGDTELNQIIESYEEGLAKKIASVLNHTHPKAVLSALISSQLDADRMDYLLRDAYFTGTSYGHYDLERVLRTLKLSLTKVLIKESGIHTVEDYIMARYHMYWQVYYHPVSRSMEAILIGFFKRLKDLYKTDPKILQAYPMFKMVLVSPFTLEDQYILDESACFYGFQCATKDDDEILADLAKRILDRHLFDYCDYVSNRQVRALQKTVQKSYDTNYYFYQDTQSNRPYSPYDEEHDLIWILMADGSVHELSDVSTIVNAVVKAKYKVEKKVFYPKGV